MMAPLCFATNNPHKLSEVRALLTQHPVRSLQDIGCTEELPEDFDTLEENSSQKARYVSDHFQVDCFADDSGLEVEALLGAPGAISAMYAGPERDSEKNIDLLLKNLEGVDNRRARFRTVITLIENGKTLSFEGVVNGIITTSRKGTNGFGYDPVFQPDGFSRTMAELSMDEKNKISHRARAVALLVSHLQNRTA